MDKSTVIKLIKSYEEQSQIFREVAQHECSQGQPWAVWEAVKNEMSCQSKIRQLQNRHQHILVNGK